MNELAEIDQAEHVKKGCREYGVGIIAGVIFAIIVSMGWHYWQQGQENNLLLASMEYRNLLDAANQKNPAFNRIATVILQNYLITEKLFSKSTIEQPLLPMKINNLTGSV